MPETHQEQQEEFHFMIKLKQATGNNRRGRGIEINDNNQNALLELAEEYFNKDEIQNKIRGMNLFYSLAQKGIAQALNKIAICYIDGIIVGQDIAKGILMLEDLAKEQNNDEARKLLESTKAKYSEELQLEINQLKIKLDAISTRFVNKNSIIEEQETKIDSKTPEPSTPQNKSTIRKSFKFADIDTPIRGKRPLVTNLRKPKPLIIPIEEENLIDNTDNQQTP